MDGAPVLSESAQLENLRRENAELKRQLENRQGLPIRQRVQERERWMHAAGAVAWEWDLRTRRLNWDSGYTELFGVSSSVDCGDLQQLMTVLHSDDGHLIEESMRAAEQGEDMRVTFRIYRHGEIRWLQSTGSVMEKDGETPVRVCGITLDVTERKKTELALEQSIRALKSANEELQQFAYAASHDLQEPLRTISSYAQLLARHCVQDDESKEFTSFIVEAVQRMNVLIQDLLAYSRVGASQNSRRRVPVQLGGVLQWTLLNLQQSIAEQNGEVTYDELPEVIADEMQLVQLFQNLISNALKYRSEHPPKIHVSAEPRQDEWLISVVDNGVGIDPKYHHQVFGVFKRLHGRNIPGTGIGLALCRKILEGHDGKIWVESDGIAGKGSRFCFTLPRSY